MAEEKKPQGEPTKEEEPGTGVERPVDIIRRMNPGQWIPDGKELAELVRKRMEEKN